MKIVLSLGIIIAEQHLNVLSTNANRKHAAAIPPISKLDGEEETPRLHVAKAMKLAKAFIAAFNAGAGDSSGEPVHEPEQRTHRH
jgi:hypothetical protein